MPPEKGKRLQDILDVALPAAAFIAGAADPNIARAVGVAAGVANQRLRGRIAGEESKREQAAFQAGAPQREAQTQAGRLVQQDIFKPTEQSQTRIQQALSQPNRGFEGGLAFDLPQNAIQPNAYEAAGNIANLQNIPGGARLLTLAGGNFANIPTQQTEAIGAGARALSAATSAAKEQRLSREQPKVDFGLGDKLDSKIVQMFPETVQGEGRQRQLQQPSAAQIGAARTALVEEEEASAIRIARARGLTAGQLHSRQMAADRKAKRDFELNRPLVDAKGDEAPYFVYTGRQGGTIPGQSVNGNSPVRDVYAQVGQGAVKRLTSKQFQAVEVRRQLAPVIQKIRDGTESLYKTGIFSDAKNSGLLARVIRGGRTISNAVTQNYPRATALARDIQSNVDLVRRAILEQVGTQTERDAIRGLQTFVDSTGLFTDSEEVAFRTTNNLIRTVNSAMQTTLDNPDIELINPLPIESKLPPPPKNEAEAQAILQRLQTRFPNETYEQILTRINRGER